VAEKNYYISVNCLVEI